jgi:transposase
LDEEIDRLDEEIKKRMLPFEEDLELLDTIPGVARRTAETILAEIGSNMDQYPSAAHLCSWEGCVRVRTKVPENECPVRREKGTRSSGVRLLKPQKLRLEPSSKKNISLDVFIRLTAIKETAEPWTRK